MRKLMILTIGAIACLLVSPAVAFPPFKTEFQKKYVDPSDNDDFEAAVKKAGCYSCHVKGAKSKKELNAYGHELHEALEESGENPKDLMKKDKAKLLMLLDEAFDAVYDKKADDEKTFGDRIEAGELPAWKEVEKE